jgi:glucoamylase
MWAHAEYVRLLRSAADGVPFDRIPAVADRYLVSGRCRPLEIWKFSRQTPSMAAGMPLRIQAEAPFRLRWTRNAWDTWQDSESTPVSALGVHFVDIQVPPARSEALTFTFFWTENGRWEGRNFDVRIKKGE